jgi:hypothetical protein
MAEMVNGRNGRKNKSHDLSQRPVYNSLFL